MPFSIHFHTIMIGKFICFFPSVEEWWNEHVRFCSRMTHPIKWTASPMLPGIIASSLYTKIYRKLEVLYLQGQNVRMVRWSLNNCSLPLATLFVGAWRMLRSYGVSYWSEILPFYMLELLLLSTLPNNDGRGRWFHLTHVFCCDVKILSNGVGCLVQSRVEGWSWKFGGHSYYKQR